MPTPEYIKSPKQPPHHRGNTYASGYDRPWFGPVDDAERVLMLAQLEGALLGAQLIAQQLGQHPRDYEITIRCLREDARKERRTITEGSK